MWCQEGVLLQSWIKTDPCLNNINHRVDSIPPSNSSLFNNNFSNYRFSNKWSSNSSNNICHNNSLQAYPYLHIYKTHRYYCRAIAVESKHPHTWAVITMATLCLLHRHQLIIRVCLATSILSLHWNQRGHLRVKALLNLQKTQTSFSETETKVSFTKVEALRMGKLQ